MEYILDIKKWRSGGDGHLKVGTGDTKLLNSDGYMCCLGQFAEQKGVSKESLLDRAEPECLGIMYDENFVHEIPCWDPDEIEPDEEMEYDFINTELAGKLMEFNDEEDMTVGARIEGIRRTLEKAGHTLKVVNIDNVRWIKEEDPIYYPIESYRVTVGDQIIVSNGKPFEVVTVTDFDSSMVTVQEDDGEVTDVLLAKCHPIEVAQ